MSRILSLLLLLGLAVSVSGQSPSSNCPTIVVTGPAGITSPGDPMVFTVDLSWLEDLGPYIWTVSAGTIESGQGTRSIAVRTTPAEEGSNVTATVTLQGAPAGCTNTASEAAPVAIRSECGLSVDPPVDSYEKVTWNEERARMDNVLIQFNKTPDSRLFIYLRITSDESFDTTKKHARKMVKHFVWRDQEFDVSRVVVVIYVDDRHSTVFDLVPPGAKPRLCETGCIEISGSDLAK